MGLTGTVDEVIFEGNSQVTIDARGGMEVMRCLFMNMYARGVT